MEQEKDYAILEWEEDEKKHNVFIENLAPIVLFTYNRLAHTQQTVEALQRNVYARESRLIIYSDAPKNETAKEEVAAVRSYLKGVDGFKEITLIERETNWGLARNIIDGVTKVVKRYGKIIVLEDDIVTSKYFLKYMNDALEIYKNEERVMAISGYMFPLKENITEETYFLKSGFCWGWGTWAERWAEFKRDPEWAVNAFSKEEIYHFTTEGTSDAWEQVLANKKGKLYTWAIFWNIAIFKRNGYTLLPSISLSKNIGMDGSGEHCGASNVCDVPLNQRPVKYFSKCIEENAFAREQMREFFRKIRPSLFVRMKNKLKLLLQGV